MEYYYKIDTSFHEASHVVIGSLFNIKIEYCQLEKELGAGWTEGKLIQPSDYFNEKINNYLINSWVCFNYAGMLVDRHNFTLNTGSKKYPKAIKIGASLDIKEASNIIVKYNVAPPGKERNAFKQKMQRKTNKLIKKYWNDIVLIAHAIYNAKNHIIYYEDIENILTKSSEYKYEWKEKFKQIDYLHSVSRDDLDSSYFKNIV